MIGKIEKVPLREEKYEEVQDAMIDAVIRLEKSFRSHIAKLKI